jgi:hypothetical protein
MADCAAAEALLSSPEPFGAPLRGYETARRRLFGEDHRDQLGSEFLRPYGQLPPRRAQHRLPVITPKAAFGSADATAALPHHGNAASAEPVRQAFAKSGLADVPDPQPNGRSGHISSLKSRHQAGPVVQRIGCKVRVGRRSHVPQQSGWETTTYSPMPPPFREEQCRLVGHQAADRVARGSARAPRNASRAVDAAAITANRQALIKIWVGARFSDSR